MTPDILSNMCEYREQYLATFKRLVDRRLFQAQKYKDVQSYERYAQALRLHNMLKQLLDVCGDD